MTTTWYNFNKMTSNTSPSPFVASASSEYNHEYEAWRSFNGARHPYQQWVTNKNDTEGWNQIYVKDPVLVNVIKMCSGTDGTHASGAGIMPQWLEILGSNDGVSFESLGVFTTPLWIKNQEREFVFNNKKLFSYFRISVKNAGATGWGVGFDEVYFGFNPDYLKSENKTLILSNGEYKKFNRNLDKYDHLAINHFKFNEGSGTTVNDSKSNIIGAVYDSTWADGGLNFSGTSPNIQLNSPLIKKGEKTIVFKVKMNSISSSIRVLWGNSHESSSQGYYMINYNNSRKLTLATRTASSVTINECVFEFQDNVIYDVKIIYGSNGSVIWFIDNVEYSSKGILNEFTVEPTLNFVIGKYLMANFPYYAIGWSIYDFKVFDKDITKLSPNEILTVSNTLPTTTQFLEQGMDNLSPLLDRKVTTLEPMPMTNKSEILGVGDVGKVFSKSIDLKKYFDIRSVKVEVK